MELTCNENEDLKVTQHISLHYHNRPAEMFCLPKHRALEMVGHASAFVILLRIHDCYDSSVGSPTGSIPRTASLRRNGRDSSANQRILAVVTVLFHILPRSGVHASLNGGPSHGDQFMLEPWKSTFRCCKPFATRIHFRDVKKKFIEEILGR